MAPIRTSQPNKVFIDSSVLIAAAISAKGAARQLILQGSRGECTLCLSNLVLEETERNLARKAPAALPAFKLLREAFAAEVIDPPLALVMKVAQTIELKDAPIVAGAVHARAQYLATYDRKHLLSQKKPIEIAYGLTMATPDEVVRLLQP